MKIDNRQRLLTLLAGGLIALWAGDSFVLTPLTKAWKGRQTRIAELKRSVERGASLVSRQETLENAWKRMRTNTLPSTISMAETRMLKAVDEWAQNSRVTISSIKPQWKRSADDHMLLECRIDASGSLSALTRFLYDVERDPLALRVEAVELNSRDTGGQQLNLAIQLSGLALIATEQ